MVDRKNDIKGIVLVIISTILWGINGNIGSYLFENKEITPELLTFFRLTISGLILLPYQYIKNGEEIFEILYNKKETLRLLYFSFFGLLSMQYGYFVTVKYSNAATATILQSLSPFIIVGIILIKTKVMPSNNIFLALIFAFAGVFLLITHGRPNQLVIGSLALVFGIIAALGSVNYNLSSGTLQEKYSTVLIVGWAMLITGIIFGIVVRPWKIFFIKDIISILGITYVGIFGTLFPFLTYLMGCKIIGPQRAGILSLIEPVVSTLVAVLFMGERFLFLDYLGITMVIIALFILTWEKPNNSRLK